MGHLSGRARKLRLGLSFARSFSHLLSRTDVIEPSKRIIRSEFAAIQRVSCKDSQTQFIFFRNFSSTKAEASKVQVVSSKYGHFDLPIQIPFKQSFVGLSNYKVGESLTLVASTLPIYLRTQVEVGGRSCEIWIVQCDAKFNGSLAFSGQVVVRDGSLLPTVSFVSDDKVSVVSWSAPHGWLALACAEGQTDLYILSLPEKDLYTLQPHFRESFWADEGSSSSPEIPLGVMWGTYGAHLSTAKGLHVERSVLESGSALFAFGSSVKSFAGFESVVSGSFAGLPFLVSKDLSLEEVQLEIKNYVLPIAKDWKTRAVDFNSFKWQTLPMKTATIPDKNTIDFAYTSGHVFYRLRFAKPKSISGDLKFDVNLRHRGSVYLNGQFVSSHIVYSLGVFRAGSKNGPDNTYGGKKCVLLPESLLKSGENSLVVMVESFGLNRQPFSFNDIRCPRGIIEASIQGIRDISWEICGVDVRELKDAYNISGIPGQNVVTGYSLFKNVSIKDGSASLDFKGLDTPAWFTSAFDVPSQDDSLRVPLRLSLSGLATSYVSINDIMIARYYGNGDGPQSDFYIPDGLLKPSKNTIQVLAYRTQTGDSTLGVSFKFWNMSKEDPWSGNLEDLSDLPLVIVNETIATC